MGRQRKAMVNKLRKAKRNEKKKKETEEEKQNRFARHARLPLCVPAHLSARCADSPSAPQLSGELLLLSEIPAAMACCQKITRWSILVDACQNALFKIIIIRDFALGFSVGAVGSSAAVFFANLLGDRVVGLPHQWARFRSNNSQS
jgi:hypothetical protein